MGICITWEDFCADKIFDETNTAPTCRVVRVGDPPGPKWPPHQLVVTDHGLSNSSQNRWFGQALPGRRHDKLGKHIASLVDQPGPCHNVTVPMPMPMPVTLTTTPLETIPELGLDSELDRPWSTTVWDDPINLMKYVTYVFMEYFAFSKEKADYLMLLVHTEGKATVSTGSREAMEQDVVAMHTYGLWATLSQD